MQLSGTSPEPSTNLPRRPADETQASLEKLASGEPDVEAIARAVVEHIARALHKANESTEHQAQAGPEQLEPRKPDVTNIDANADREDGAFRRRLFDTNATKSEDSPAA